MSISELAVSFTSQQHQLKGALIYFLIVYCYVSFLLQNFKDEDVFVCESRYNVKTKTFKKTKVKVSSVQLLYSVSCLMALETFYHQ